MIFSRTAAITIALTASQFLTGVSAGKVEDIEVLKRALGEAGISGDAAAGLLGASAAAYKGYGAEILGDHLAAATASDGIDASLPFGLAEGGIHRDAGASIMKRGVSSTRSEEGEIFKRFLSEAGYNANSAGILDQIVDVVKKDDEESNIMRRQIATAFGPEAASGMLAGVTKRSEPEIPMNNKIGLVRRALIEGSIGADANAEVLGATAGATAGAYAGAEGELLGDHLAEATASAGIGAGLPLGLAEGDVNGQTGAAILKRALAEAGISGNAAAGLLGASAAAYKGYGAEILGDHLAEATASDGIDASLPFGLAEGGIHRDAGAAIL